MSDEHDELPNDPTTPPPPDGNGAGDDGHDDDGGDDGGDDGPDDGGADGAGAAGPGGGPSGQPVQPGQPGLPGQGKRRRRRRRRKGNPVFFTEDGQAFRKVIQPDGQVVNIFLTAQELEQYKQRLAQQQAQQQQQQQQRQAQQAGQPVQVPTQLVEGVLDTDVKGQNAMLRSLKRNLLPGPDDAEIPKNLVQKLRLRTGQFLTAKAQMKGLKGTIVSVETVDGVPMDQATRAPHFNDLTSVDPVERLTLEHQTGEMVTRVLDLIAPLGKGQRALITAPPKTGKTIILQKIAQAVLANHPECHVMVLLIDERPEEVTDMRRNIKAEVLASSSDQSPAMHLKVAELAMERARRLVENGKDVVVLLDSITRLARAFNKEVDSSGRTMSGGVDSRALERPKRMFGAARATEEGGTLTIIGTALIDTGSRMDEVIFEEFKGTGNSEVVLDRLLAEKRIWPAINIPQSGTRKEEKLFVFKEYEKVKKLRQMLFSVKPVEAMEALIKRLTRYRTNEEFLEEL
ncbi:MAG: transcription termination factor Rho [Myxococcaceae bacterium]|jgi:transcription termination factor Rho|nr:transcription termination factor Rho [Myxococcaceae bacterium]MCA3016418.1 transcription termination factor Rho [Myxococcaceae bacterium]